MIDTETRWLTERDIARLSGLPGPLIAELIPHLPTPDAGGYSTDAEVYTEDSVHRARLAAMLLRSGIRLRYIRIAMDQPQTSEQLKDACERWDLLEFTPKQPAPRLQALTPAVPGSALLTAALIGYLAAAALILTCLFVTTYLVHR
jgi:hypothetical protein